jgi:hypothetical protein
MAAVGTNVVIAQALTPQIEPSVASSVGCGTQGQTQSAMQSDTRNSTAAHMTLWFAFTMMRAT